MLVKTNKFSPKESVRNMILMVIKVCATAIATMLVIPTSSSYIMSPVLMATSLPLSTEPSIRSSSVFSSRSFGDFNKIFENASILIPGEFRVTEEVAFIDLNMNIWNIKCYDMSVGDITVDHEQKSDTTFFVTIDVTNISLTCEMSYDYSYGILAGDGWVQIQTENSDVSSTISFTSLDFDQNYPPTDLAINGCFSDVEIEQMDFEEDFASEVLEVFQALIRNTVEIAIGDVACEELAVIGTNVVGNMIDMAADQLEPYLGYLGEKIIDPLYLEQNLVLPDTLEALNLQDMEGDVAKTFNEVLQFFDAHLGTTISASGGVAGSSSNSNELVINSILRSFFLNDDGSFTLDQTFISKVLNPVLFEGHDRLSEFTITLNEIRLHGFDSITRFNSFRAIGKHTLQTEFTWDLLRFEFDMTVDIKPSRLDDAILINPTSSGISEHFSIDFNVNNIDVEASLLLVLDEIAVGSMELGSLFYTETLLPCLLSVVHEVEISGLDIDPSFINEAPTVDSFLSSGLDRAISDSVEAAFAIYKESLRVAIPNIFQTTIRDFINSFFIETNSNCPQSQLFGEDLIDFRKFFSSEDSSHGDLPAMLKNLLDEELLSTNPETGTSRINEAVIAPLTVIQSGIKGTLIYPSDLFNFLIPEAESKKFGIETFELRLFNPKIVNVDTIGVPIQLFEPNATDGHVLDNYATLGSVERNFRLGLKGLFAITGDSALSMTNELDISLDLAGSDAWVSLMAKVDADTLFNFPLRDMTNLQCWLHTLVTPDALNDSKEVGFSILHAFLTTTSTSFNLTCERCTSFSLSILPEILDWLDTFGVSDIIEEKFVKLSMELMRSDFSQDYINGILIDAAIRCPHSRKFVGSTASISESTSIGFPYLENQSLETIVFVSIVITEIMIVVTAEAHESYDLEATFPLSGQYDLSIANDVRFVDFTSLETSLGKWASFSVDDIIILLNGGISNSNEISDTNDQRINNITRAFLLDENGQFTIKYQGLDLEQIGLGISIKEVSITGLDTISKIDLFDVIGAQTIQNGVIWKVIRLELVLSLKGATNLKEQDIVVSIELSNIKLSLAILLAINLDLIESLEMWSILNLKSILPCLISTANVANITELEISIGSISDISITGFNSTKTSHSANESTKLISEKYGDRIISSIPKFFDSTVRTLLNNWLQYQVDGFPSDHCKYSSADELKKSGFVDLRDLFWAVDVASHLGGTGLSQYGDMFRIGMGWVQDIFKTDDITGLSGFNEAIVEPLTMSKDNNVGTMRYHGDLYTGRNRIKVGALDTNIQFRAYDAKVENLNSVGEPTYLFSGIMGEAYMFNNTITAGVGENPLQLSSKFQLSLEGDDNININNEVDLNLELTDATMIVATLTKIMEVSLFTFPLRDIFDINCWLALIPAPSLDPQGVRKSDSPFYAAFSHLEAYVGQLKVTAACTNCSSPRMSEFTDLISSPDARNETSDVANALLEYVTKLMGGNFMQVQIDRMLNEATRMCPHSPSYDPNAKPAYDDFEAPNTTYSMSYLVVLTAVVLTMIIITTTIVLAVKWIVRRRHRKWLIKLSPRQFKNISYEQKLERFFEDKLNTSTRSLFRNTDIPCIVRYTIPIVIFCNILFFLSGHLSLGATVNIEAEIAGEKFVIEKFFEFSMARSTIDIWKAGGHELAILILVFSGIWPYTKLLLTLWLWFSSPSKMPIARRGSILLWLDCLAKWSMVDIFVLVISIAAFRISIESPNTSYLPNAFYAIEMMVIPLWGLYANMIAQLISQITSHVIIYYHRKTMSRATYLLKQRFLRIDISPASIEGQDLDAHDDNVGSHANIIIREGQIDFTSSVEDISNRQSTKRSVAESTKEQYSLSTYQFSRPHRGETEKLVARGYVKNLLLFSAFTIVVCVITGCVLQSFSLEFFGIVGVAVEYGQDFEEATFNHSVFSVIKLLYDQASYLGTTKDYLGLTVLSALFVSTILFVPIIQSITLLYQWFSYSTVNQKQKTAARLEILQAWQYLEVYLLALFISSWQLGPVSDFMINAYCKNLEETFAQMVYFGILKEEDGQCFGVSSRIGHNTFILLAGAILLAFLSSFVSKAVVQHLHDQARQGLQIQGKDDRINMFPDEISTKSSSDDEMPDSGIIANIRPVPVLFTDSFRWMLNASNAVTPSTRTSFVDTNNSHWSLPEAIVVSSINLPPNEHMRKGTYVHDLPSVGKTNTTSFARSPAATARESLKKSRGGSIDLTLSRSSLKGNYSTGDFQEKDENRLSDRRGRLKTECIESALSLGQQSICSKMDSIGSSSSIGQDFGLDSLMYPTGSSFSTESPPVEVVSTTKPPGPSPKPSPPSAYRLSEKSRKNSTSPHSSINYAGFISQKQH